MFHYWEPVQQSHQPSTSGRKILAVMVILIIIIASGGILLLQTGLPFGPQLEGNVRVAIIDSGIDPDFTLQSRIVAQRSFISPIYGYSMTDSNVTDSKPTDGSDIAVPHGTLVATTVVRNSATALLVNAKVVSFNGGATSSGIIAAINWAIEQNCSVINLSVGSAPTFGDPLESAVEYAFSKGVVVVSA
ncbi:MAG: S8 family peptidase, partial [Candidatus Thorarchaeota archaeon]